MYKLLLILTLANILIISSVSAIKLLYDTHNYYVLHHDPTYASLADVEKFFGFKIVEAVGSLENVWLAQTSRQGDGSEQNDPVMKLYRKMRSRPQRGDKFPMSLKHLSRQTPKARSQNAPPTHPRLSPRSQHSSNVMERGLPINDPLFGKQWYLRNEDYPKNSLHVLPLWEAGFTGKEAGETGKDIIVAVLDDGIMHDHEDLKDNFATEYSYDYITDSSTTGKLHKKDTHGTATAGIIAAAKNKICGVGIAYEAKVASLRIMSYETRYLVQEIHESDALNFKYKDVSIYTSGYGTLEGGQSLGGPAHIVKMAMLKGVNGGRYNGKGNIYVHAAGNTGGADDCNYNGYVNSIYTIAIGAVSPMGKRVSYSTPCTAVMVVAYGEDDDPEGTDKIVTLGTSSKVECREGFLGTSATAPAAAAVFALALDANPDLSWRDLQYLSVETARRIGDGMEELPSGRFYSNQLGFGLLDARAFVVAARDWKPVNHQVWMSPNYEQFEGGTMDPEEGFTGGTKITRAGVSRTIEITEKMAEIDNFDTIEHVQVRVWIEHSRRGDIEVSLTSPNNVVSELARARERDSASTGLQGWTFMSLKHWGEKPTGTWTLTVKDQSGTASAGTGKMIGFTMMLWGSATKNEANPKLYEIPADDMNIFPPT